MIRSNAMDVQDASGVAIFPGHTCAVCGWSVIAYRLAIFLTRHNVPISISIFSRTPVAHSFPATVGTGESGAALPARLSNWAMDISRSAF